MRGLASVTHYESGTRLLASVLKNAVPDVVFVADFLTDMSGMEVCRQILLDPAARSTPVVVMSKRGDDNFVRAVLKAGAADVLLKPLSAELLAARIRSYVALNGSIQAQSFEARTRFEEMERMVGTMRTELEDRERVMARSEFLFNHDLVTGLPNRKYLLEQLDRALRRVDNDKLPIAIIALQIEQFSNLRNTLEADVMDRLLAAAAVCMQNTLRPLDLVARVTEDLFVGVLVPREIDTAEAAAGNAREVAARAATHLRDDLLLDGKRRALRIRTAVAVHPSNGRRAADLLLHLESTLAITAGSLKHERHRAVTPDLATSLAMELRLRQAIDNDRLVPFYQPKVDSRSGRIVGGETLIRWPLRNGEFVGPADFIPVAEAAGLVTALDEYVLTAACTQIAEWQTRFSAFRIGVNLSAFKLNQRAVLERLRELFAITGARPEHLELEITESALITDFESARTWLGAVRQLGVTVALDDFGTGYSSLAYLRKLPLDAIKVDQTFVAGLESDSSTLAIVRAMIAMARALDLKVVAEGVENQRQVQILTELGCTTMQGFYYSPGVPARRFEAMLERGVIEILPAAALTTVAAAAGRAA